MAERILLNEFKSLSQEKWVEIEVKSPFDAVLGSTVC